MIIRNIAAFFLFILVMNVNAADLAFAPVQDIGRGSYPMLIDVDNDGDLDVVALKNVGFTLQPVYTPIWQENQGTTWTEHSIIDWQSMGMQVCPADLDGDGDMDLVIAMWGILKYDEHAGMFAWLENDGAQPPRFIPHFLATTPPGGYGRYDICVADMDGDGDMDVVANYGATADQENKGLIYWYENDRRTPPGFTPHLLAETTKPILDRLAVADVNGDGRMDVLTASTGQVTPGVYRGTDWYQNLGGTPPVFKRQVLSLWPYRGQIRTADLNGDGRLDVLLGFSWFENRGGEPTSFTTHLLTQDFQPTWGDYGEVAVGDLDRDGHTDAITYSPSNNFSIDLYAFQNDGKTSPTFVRQLLGDAAHRTPVVGDLDGDGNLDIVCSEDLSNWYPPNSLKWYRNQMPLQPVTVLAPNDAGRVFASGGPLTIHWRTDVALAGKKVVLELWRGTKRICWLANSSNEQGRGSVTVTLPSVPTGSDYRIRALSGDNRALDDFSDEPFIIHGIFNGVRNGNWTCYQ